MFVGGRRWALAPEAAGARWYPGGLGAGCTTRSGSCDDAPALDYWSDWGEYYADVKQPGYRTQILSIAGSLMAKGFDGLFLDSVDMVDSHPAQTDGMRTLVTDLSALVKRAGGLLFAQNGDAFELTLAPLLDGWNREDVTFTYNFDNDTYIRVPAADHAEALSALTAMRAAGLLVTATDYVKTAGSAQEKEAVRVALGAGALPYVSDIGLNRIPAKPFGL